jgi:hypothetical protein
MTRAWTFVKLASCMLFEAAQPMTDDKQYAKSNLAAAVPK